MDDNIKKIVVDYINEKEYEKALSLLKATKGTDDTETELWDKCKKEFSAQCSEAIAAAVKDGKKEDAEKILANYEKLLGEDSNTSIYRTLIDAVQDKESKKSAEKTAAVSMPDFSGILENCGANLKRGKSWIIWTLYAVLIVVAFIFGIEGEGKVTILVAPIIVGVALGYPVALSENRRFRILAYVLLLLPVIAALVYFSDGIYQYRSSQGKLYIPWILSFANIIVYFNVAAAGKGKVFKYIASALLFTVFNPLFYALGISPGTEIYINRYGQESWEYSSYFQFTAEAAAYMMFAAIATVIIIALSLKNLKGIKEKIVSHKRQIGITAGSIVGLFIVAFIIMILKDSHDAKVAREQAIAQAYQDSIQAEENARLAAIERRRQDSIAAIRAIEQARRDSIDYAQHAGFVSKYANLGLIITNLSMTRGTNDNGVPCKGIKFTVFNPTHKTIKYVIASVQAVNQFGDRVSYDERCRGMGPVDSHEYGSWEFDDVFPDRNGVIDDLKVAFQVVYTNGSTKTIRWKDAYVTDLKPSWFRNR